MASHPYTCLSCGLAFSTAQTQRAHYTTDLHRYNAKRAVAGLSPVDLNTFTQKFSSTPATTDSSNPSQSNYNCLPCGKSFNTEPAQKSHLLSKKHHQTLNNQQVKAPLAKQPAKTEQSSSNPIGQLDGLDLPEKIEIDPIPSGQKKAELERLIESRIEQAPRIESNECLFCPRSSSVRFKDAQQALDHMLHAHGFFLPDQEFLVDKLGLLAYLAETIAVWNVCLYCGTGFGGKILNEHLPQDHASLTRKGLESVRKHMCDKNHCKLAWDTERQRLEYSDFFDYRASYKNVNNNKALKNKVKASRISGMVEEEEWEDVSSEDETMSDGEESLGAEAVMGDSAFELVLPNGVRLGHRSLRYIYKQNLLPYAVGSQSTQAGNRNINLITRLAVLSSPAGGAASTLTDQVSSILAPRTMARPSSKTASLTDAALIPSRGGGINFNSRDSKINHQDLVIKARNRGEAKMAGHHIRTFKDVHKRQLFQTRVGCTSGNNQTHYRDPLLQ
ncbi:hypothetical protein MJO28_009962 [Puccinia striiformis f. sp. tritici]|uniref:C2H2-type domain-containing protein n=3 Tax=Puccinia striiformis TaxID=27350 RepID=A0A0L0V897_9BASI|nr:hypothetical protein Pst134EA_017212 [Puccinia striiformis f. sp. tritici]KAH9460900.1 hypothetical protein Pst134EA_017212 [Puccinia striiformis f. sp. tritici]KAI7948054.1 hypothetical protein MJO28_009962 [Puccinia striiformis f. sp. tritici]KNE95497.1 hypothetical protein PSTG_11209 [Puccinia striiformis f. sp. tritici PST-78]POW00513.1 hypothetical protein PSTT_13078 [Puccinia striiformis]